MDKLTEIADRADMIVNGYAFTQKAVLQSSLSKATAMLFFATVAYSRIVR